MIHLDQKARSGWIFFLAIMVLSVLPPTPTEARYYGRHGYGPGFAGWHRGYWFHGAYNGWVGWWWVLGPSWYYYSAPTYPYPPATAQPVYVVQVPNSPPPATPPPAPPTNIATQPAMAAPAARPMLPSLPAAAPNTEAGRTSAKTEEKPKAVSYFCEKSKAYYPLVKTCDDAWVATPVAPPN